MNGYLSDRVQVTLLYRPFQSPANRSLRVGTDREISASFEQEKSATEVGQPTPVG